MIDDFDLLPRDDAFEPPHMVHVGDDALARLAGNGRDQRHAAGRHVGDLTGELTPVRQHVAAQEIDGHALETAPFLAERQAGGLRLR